nr:lactonase family protein [Rufibacter roseus]
MKALNLFLLFLGITLAACTSVKKNEPTKEQMVYVGTYAKPDAESIFAFSLNEKTGELTKVLGIKGGENPSFLALDADRKHLYAVNETTEYQGQKSGFISAFAVDQQTGNLTKLNEQPSHGGAPCYISLDHRNKVVLVANYVGGNVVANLLKEDGSLGVTTASDQHQGSGPKKQQDAAHAHCIIPDPNNKFALAVDLGVDKVYAYALEADHTELTRTPKIAYSTKAGAGPRHLVFHPNKKYAYLINELNSTMVALTYNSENGTFTENHTVSTLPEGFTGESFCADVHVSKDGRFVYGSNRGHNSIVVFAIDQNTNKLSLVQHIGTEGNWPRNFGFSPSGKTMLVATSDLTTSLLTKWTLTPEN